jgi:hypothetical protein
MDSSTPAAPPSRELAVSSVSLRRWLTHKHSHPILQAAHQSNSLTRASIPVHCNPCLRGHASQWTAQPTGPEAGFCHWTVGGGVPACLSIRGPVRWEEGWGCAAVRLCASRPASQLANPDEPLRCDLTTGHRVSASSAGALGGYKRIARS